MAMAQKRAQKYGFFLVLVLFFGLFALSTYTGLTDLNAESISTQVERAGVWGFIFYNLIFAGGEFIHIPGMVFVAAGILVYGKVLGFVLALIASVVSVCFSFLVVRAIGGKPLTTTVEGRERYPVRVRYLRELRDNMESLEKMAMFWLFSPIQTFSTSNCSLLRSHPLLRIGRCTCRLSISRMV